MKVKVVSRPTEAAGFELAGLGVTRVRDGTEAAQTISRFADDVEIGVVLVENALYRSLPTELLARLDRRAVPILAPVPPARWEERSEAENYLLDVLQQAIGYRVRLR